MEVKQKTFNKCQSGSDQRSTLNVQCREAFTLIELLVVISIIIILMGLLFPAFRGATDQTKRVQAKNDLTQVVTAVNAYYTEYGKYPLTTQGTDAQITNDNSDVMYALRAVASGANGSDVLNPRRVVFISPPDVKDASNPRSGISSDGIFYDPWGKSSASAEAGIYHIAIDGNYDATIVNPYGPNNGAGVDPLRQGILGWCLGKDGKLGTNGNNIFTGSDDVISWQ